VILEKQEEEEDVEWIHLAQDRGKWCASVNKVMKLRVPKCRTFDYLKKYKLLNEDSTTLRLSLG
jgi:hypothetical protein